VQFQQRYDLVYDGNIFFLLKSYSLVAPLSFLAFFQFINFLSLLFFVINLYHPRVPKLKTLYHRLSHGTKLSILAECTIHERHLVDGRCQKRSEETFSKQSYHHGTVIIRCEGCRNLHLIADHLKIVSDAKVELEDILQGKVTVRRGVYIEDRGSVVELGEPEADSEIAELVAREMSSSKEEDK
jgi:hypothetical protein